MSEFRRADGAADPRPEQARRLRADPGLSLSQLCGHFGVGRDVVAAWLWGDQDARVVPGDARSALRARACDLRRAGRTVPQIAAELVIAKSTAYQWVKHLPLDATAEQGAERRRRHSRRMTDARWQPHRAERDARRATVRGSAAAAVGALSDREVLLLGATAYWCEGVKAKPWRPHACVLSFINSDPGLVLLFLRFVELLGVDRGDLRYRISIHESADAVAAGRWWAGVTGVPFGEFRRPTVKKHNPATVRHNVGEDYRGCLIVYVPRSKELYWRAEGVMEGITVAASGRGHAKMLRRT